MRKKKEKKTDKFCNGGKCNCEMKKKLIKIFPYHSPNCLTDVEYDLIGSKATPEEELGRKYMLGYSTQIVRTHRSVIINLKESQKNTNEPTRNKSILSNNRNTKNTTLRRCKRKYCYFRKYIRYRP